MKRVSKIKGEYTCSDLDARFAKVYRIGRRVAYVNSSTGHGVLAHLMSWLNSSMTFTLPIKNEEKLNPAKETNISLLERAQKLWNQGKRLDAVRVLQLTDGATRRIASDFIEDARRHEETLFLTRLLLAHSALTSIRSTY
ncbi:unnamed protein product [Caenorhabditis angaria]|uniref:MICOS complex subunit MIC60 n=1 Tax=Caenorhabditis angaria TaxID=860376 RepID=A0A9P1ISJ8_9PELO|nr:unnamed protein product [Caenorhabditis angaria]